MTRTVKEIIGKSAAKVTAFGALAMARASYMIYSDAFDSATTAASTLQGKLYTLAQTLFPLAIVITAIAMLFTRDQKKFDAEKHILIGCCLAFALLVLVDQGNLVTTIKGLFTGATSGATAGTT